jgi:hypothetical protein
MRALDRLALYITCVAGAVLVGGTALFFHDLRPSFDKLKQLSRREQSVVRPVDLSRLTPEIRRAVERARAEAVQYARQELEAVHSEIMHKVDTDLLDWYFAYGTQQRLALTYAVNSGTTWIAGLFVNVDPAETRRKFQDQIAREFELRVMPRPMLEVRLQRIAQSAVTAFINTLQGHLEEIPKQYGVPPAQWDDYLERITVLVAATEGSRSVPLTLKALSAGLVWSAAGVTTAIAPLVTAQLARNVAVAGAGRATAAMSSSVGRYAAATATRQLAARGVAAGAGAWGGAATGGIVLAAVVAWEAWDHTRTVAENKPLLRRNIDGLLRHYQAELLQPHGMVGAILHNLETQIATNIPS